MKTIHQYIDKYPIRPESEKLILGTIHPHNIEDFQLPFFYGNRLSIWKILNEAFPGELGTPITLEGIRNFLDTHKIAISDTIVECERINPTALDKDLNPTKLNHDLKEQIKHSNIKEIFFTSGFQKNNAFKLFYVDILGLTITDEIKKAKETILDKQHFGRPVKLTILHSPSGAANISLSISKEYRENEHKYAGSTKPVHAYKVDCYREKFNLF